MSGSYVYFIKPKDMDGPIKIGCSDIPTNRLASLLCWSPFPLEIVVAIPGSLDLERNIHECFLDAHWHGEWFHAIPRLTEAVGRLVAGVPVAKAIDLADRRGKRLRKRPELTEEAKLRRSYLLRITAAKRKLRTTEEFHNPPADAQLIIQRWRGRTPTGRSFTPSPAELARLDQILANPEQHFVARRFSAAA